MIRKEVQWDAWEHGPYHQTCLLVLVRPLIYLLCDLGQVMASLCLLSNGNISTCFIGLFGYKMMTHMKCVTVLIIDS